MTDMNTIGEKMDARKYIIDTDIGDDIDDIFAIYLAMRLKLNIVGITTVFRNTSERSRIVKKLLRSYANGYENVPVYTGYGQTFENTADTINHLVQYTSDLELAEYTPDSEDPEMAIDFLIDSCNRYGEDLTIIAIGPFTNMARAIQKAPKAFEKCKVVIMGGAFFKQYADWNVMCDVPAADILFRSYPQLECLGADVTHMLNIGEKNAKKILTYEGKNAAVLYIKELLALWTKCTGSTPMLHDPLAVYYALNPTICKMKKASIVVLTDSFAKGVTFNVDAYGKSDMNPAYKGFDVSKKISVAANVKKEEMIELFMNEILAED